MTILGTGGAALSIIAQAALDGVKIAVYNRKARALTTVKNWQISLNEPAV